MISIRGSIPDKIINEAFETHTNFVIKEVNIRIDFYINLFETIKNIKKNTKVTIIEEKVKKHIHHTQYESFIKIIYIKEKSFTKKKYSWLKKSNLFKDELRDCNKVIHQLKLLKKCTKYIISLDLSSNENNLKIYLKFRNRINLIKCLLSKIFDYDNWFNILDLNKDWGPYQLTTKLDLKTCCYCNNNYTFSITEGQKKVMRPDLDHFLPKSEHPLLALSFYNLIPSCKICNQTLKHDVSFNYEDYISPYENNPNHNYLQFDYYPKDYEASIGNSDKLYIITKNNGLVYGQEIFNKLKNHQKVFKYDIVYNCTLSK